MLKFAVKSCNYPAILRSATSMFDYGSKWYIRVPVPLHPLYLFALIKHAYSLTKWLVSVGVSPMPKEKTGELLKVLN